MTFAEILQTSRPTVISALLARTAILNRMVKTMSRADDRRRIYAQKVAAISRLIVLGGGRVEELLLERGLVTVFLANGRRQHVPIRRLSSEAKQVLKADFEKQLTG